MTQPDALRSTAPLIWSAGRGTDVWALFQACVAGDLDAVRRLLQAHPRVATLSIHTAAILGDAAPP